MDSIRDNLNEVRDKIAAAAERSGRSPAEIQLVAVTKMVDAGAIEEAISCGASIVGENRVQSALAKHALVESPAQWHLVGHLQRNKVKKALEIFDLIHSLDSFRLAEEINRRSLEMGRPTDVLVQVNTSGEESKYGLSPEGVLTFLESLGSLEGLRCLGLMTIGAFLPDPEQVRPCFLRLRKLFQRAGDLGVPNVEMRFLSMGMSNDFPVAIEEGANMVRIGTAIFGA